jgi:hypothetical protein
MPRRVNQVKNVFVTVLGLVRHAGGLQLNGNSPLPFQVHTIEVLSFHIPVTDCAGAHQQSIGQRRLTVIDMGNDGKVTDSRNGNLCHKRLTKQ